MNPPDSATTDDTLPYVERTENDPPTLMPSLTPPYTAKFTPTWSEKGLSVTFGLSCEYDEGTPDAEKEILERFKRELWFRAVNKNNGELPYMAETGMKWYSLVEDAFYSLAEAEEQSHPNISTQLGLNHRCLDRDLSNTESKTELLVTAGDDEKMGFYIGPCPQYEAVDPKVRSEYESTVKQWSGLDRCDGRPGRYSYRRTLWMLDHVDAAAQAALHPYGLEKTFFVHTVKPTEFKRAGGRLPTP